MKREEKSDIIEEIVTVLAGGDFAGGEKQRRKNRKDKLEKKRWGKAAADAGALPAKDSLDL
ncbi:MAG: hypothetical protein HYW95_02845 [Candidatus Wildermuthbacteria bacterium]|nr:hypothetical protein [Candidatus Wildermuthbacteria bacterium]